MLGGKTGPYSGRVEYKYKIWNTNKFHIDENEAETRHGCYFTYY